MKEYNAYIEQFEIMSHDVDMNNNVKPSVLVRFLQETANHHMRDRRPTYYELFAEGKSYILIRMKCEIKEQLKPYDRVEVLTWTGSGKGATFKRNYILRKTGNVVEGELEEPLEIARAYSEWAVVNIDDGHIFKVDEIEHGNFEVDEDIEMELPTKFHIPKDAEFEYSGSKVIGFTDCDMNRHMNNTLYQDMFWNYVPDVRNKVMTGFTMRFMKEAALGRTLSIYRSPVESVYHGDETWCFKSFVHDGDEKDSKANVEILITSKDI